MELFLYFLVKPTEVTFPIPRAKYLHTKSSTQWGKGGLLLSPKGTVACCFIFLKRDNKHKNKRAREERQQTDSLIQRDSGTGSQLQTIVHIASPQPIVPLMGFFVHHLSSNGV
jgi:hypothetical protein